MKQIISKRIQNLIPSPTLALDSKAKELARSGKNIINLGVGEPDFDTPLNIKNFAIRAIRDGFTHYTTTAGILELRQAIAKKLKKDNKLVCSPDEIVVGVGSKQLLYNAFQVILDDGDEVLLAAPLWSTYIEQIKLANGIPKIIHLNPPFKLTAGDLLEHYSPKTKIILLNSPCNPTGAIIDKKELLEIAQFAVDKNILIITDEIYEKLIYGGEHTSIASLNTQVKNQTITVNGFSKAYAMTGWRVGYAAGPKKIIKAMTDLQSQTTSNTSSISQQAALAALDGDESSIIEMCNEYKNRRDFIAEELSKIFGLEFALPEGAFYIFVSIKNLLNDKHSTSLAWCDELLDNTGVVLTPGEAFLYPGYFRLSFATSYDNLKEAVSKIKNFIYL